MAETARDAPDGPVVAGRRAGEWDPSNDFRSGEKPKDPGIVEGRQWSMPNGPVASGGGMSDPVAEAPKVGGQPIRTTGGPPPARTSAYLNDVADLGGPQRNFETGRAAARSAPQNTAVRNPRPVGREEIRTTGGPEPARLDIQGNSHTLDQGDQVNKAVVVLPPARTEVYTATKGRLFRGNKQGTFDEVNSE